jgi:alanine racemase
MGRLGVPRAEIGPFSERIMAMKGLRIDALLSHLSSADETEKAFTDDQIRRFHGAIETVQSRGARLSLNSLANSAGIMGHKDAYFQAVRPGIMLYGGLPSPAFNAPVELRPAMRFRGNVLQVRDLPHGSPVSYGRTYHTKGIRRIAVLSAGYANGLPRAISNRGQVLIQGNRVPVAGRVCMNLTVCDITAHPHVSPGDEAVFLGAQGGGCITGDDLAEWAGTISYEVFCAIGHQNPKEYVS